MDADFSSVDGDIKPNQPRQVCKNIWVFPIIHKAQISLDQNQDSQLIKPSKPSIFSDEPMKSYGVPGVCRLFPGKPRDLQPGAPASGLAKVPAAAGEAGDEPDGT